MTAGGTAAHRFMALGSSEEVGGFDERCRRRREDMVEGRDRGGRHVLRKMEREVERNIAERVG